MSNHELVLSQESLSRWFGDRAVVLPTKVLEDDGEIGVLAMYASFDEEAGVRYMQDRRGRIRIQTIMASEQTRGQDMIRWLNAAYNRTILVDEVVHQAADFWDVMVERGLIREWDTEQFTGKTVPVTPKTTHHASPEPR
ncbi:hypothetical protein ACYPKM_01700 [Pseudomonas aeruginosa]